MKRIKVSEHLSDFRLVKMYSHLGPGNLQIFIITILVKSSSGQSRSHQVVNNWQIIGCWCKYVQLNMVEITFLVKEVEDVLTTTVDDTRTNNEGLDLVLIFLL